MYRAPDVVVNCTRIMKKEFLVTLQAFVDSLQPSQISEERRERLRPLVEFMQKRVRSDAAISLNFICIHNSRRSMLSQVWAQTAAWYHGVEAECLSGGMEVTAFNERAVAALERAGYSIVRGEGPNPVHQLYFSDNAGPVKAYSKKYDAAENLRDEFAAVMVCSDADDKCPYIPGAIARIALNYEDPGNFDGQPQEQDKYDERCRQVATEMFYVFSQI